LPTLPEASGLALSRRDPNVLWSLNDSGAPTVVALSPSGELLGRVRIAGANVNDWEDVSVGPCGDESCLYIADTGNGGGTQRNDVVVYRFASRFPATGKQRRPTSSTPPTPMEKTTSPTPCSL
jgi:hypothetical protein